MESSEEKYPLLLLYAEDGARKTDFQKKSFPSENKRSGKILQGATTIITQWPDHMTTCWIMAICLALLLIFTTMFISYSFQAATLHQNLQTQCILELSHQFNNKTVHLVHEGNEWSENQLDMLQYIINVYKDYIIHVSIFETKIQKDNLTRATDNETNIADLMTSTTNTTMMTSNQTQNNNSLFIYDGQNLDTVQFFENLKRLYRNVKNILQEKKITFDSVVNNSNVIVNKYFYEEYFANTSLNYEWANLDKNMLLFSCRVNEMWQYGGLSFYLPLTNISLDTDVEIKSFILASKSIFENLPKELVSIDRSGFHIGSQIPCHSFFGELMTKISTYRFSKKTPKILIVETLEEFCKRRAVSEEDCKLI